MTSLLAKIKNYIAKYKIFKPFLKAYLKEYGYMRGYLKLIKMVIGDGLRSIYRYITRPEQRYVLAKQLVSLKDANLYTFVIFAPDYVSNSAGIYCLYKLCHDLNQRGYLTAMYGTDVTPAHLDTPIITNKKIIKHLQEKDNAWIIYAETVSGNPLRFKNVARWVLNRPGLLGGDEVYDSREKIFVYSNVYAPYVKNTIQGNLNMPTFDHSIFYPPTKDVIEKDRTLACYYVGKSTYKEGYFDPHETFEITRCIPAKKELGKLLRSSKVLYCFDNSTALIYEAIACGCAVQVIPDGTQTWEDYEKLEWGTTGIFWNKPVDKLSFDDVNTLLNKIKTTEAEYEVALDHFIQSTVQSNIDPKVAV